MTEPDEWCQPDWTVEVITGRHHLSRQDDRISMYEVMYGPQTVGYVSITPNGWQATFGEIAWGAEDPPQVDIGIFLTSGDAVDAIGMAYNAVPQPRARGEKPQEERLNHGHEIDRNPAKPQQRDGTDSYVEDPSIAVRMMWSGPAARLPKAMDKLAKDLAAFPPVQALVMLHRADVASIRHGMTELLAVLNDSLADLGDDDER